MTSFSRARSRVLLVAVLAAAVLAVPAVVTTLEACSCLPTPTAAPGAPPPPWPCKYYAAATQVFTGQVTAVTPSPMLHYVDVQLFVQEIFKGTMVSYVTIRTADTTAMCGLPGLAVGDTWLIYARGGMSGLCDGSTESFAEHLDALRSGKCNGPIPTPTPFAGNYKILARHSGKAIIEGASTANGAAVCQWSYSTAAPRNDEWQITSIGGGYYKVLARHSAKAMVVKGASTVEGAALVQWTYGGTATNDEWAIELAPPGTTSGYYRLVNRLSGKVAEVTGGSTANGAKVDQRTWSGAAHQQFQIVAVP